MSKSVTFLDKNTGMELGHRLSAMGYKYHKMNSGAAYRMIEKAPWTAKQVVLVS